MSDLARLLQQYGYGQPNALAQDGESFDTSNVLAGMPRQNALAKALQTAGVPPRDEHGFLFSKVGGELKFNPYEAIKNFMSYRAPPGALSTSGDNTPIRNAADAAGWVGLSGMGLNWAGNKIASQGSKSIKAYHGSPYDFERFSADKIGTGEGAQAYGAGLYFAEHEPVARAYREALGGTEYLVNGERYSTDYPSHIAAMQVHRVGRERALEGLKRNAERLADIERRTGQKQPDASRYLEAANLIERGDVPQVSSSDIGRMYEVRINADRDKFLDWDAPLEKQSEAVRNLAKGLDPEWVDTGGRLYEELVRRGSDGTRNDRRAEVSAQMRKAGIPGIKYLDQGSRDAGQGTSNFVVFDPALIEILRKYGLIGAVGLGSAMNAANPDNQDQ